MAGKLILDPQTRKQLIDELESSDDPKEIAAGKDAAAEDAEEGCLVCGRDDDHTYLMLCEGCNAEYHTYCLDPPLSAVPKEDWYCDACKQKNAKFDDGMDELVVALPRSYTSRFGEICWAQGGFGFGWWPACIYDPRLTEGSARQTARKNLGKRHLVYFFECHEAPFAVLSSKQINNWHEGIMENSHLGRTARAAGKQRTTKFQKALQAAILEEDKPLDMRLDWNQPDSMPQLLPIPKKALRKRKKALDVHMSPIARRSRIGVDQGGTAIIDKSSEEDGELFCKVMKRKLGSPDNDTNIGFVRLPSKRNSSFADVRKAIMNDLVPDSLPADVRWKFLVSTLGPVSTKQESSLGSVLHLLKSARSRTSRDVGSASHPLKVVIFEAKK